MDQQWKPWRAASARLLSLFTWSTAWKWQWVGNVASIVSIQLAITTWLNSCCCNWSCFPSPALPSLQSLLALALYDLQCDSKDTMFMVLPTHGWHISVSIVLVSHRLFKTRLHASMARFSERQANSTNWPVKTFFDYQDLPGHLHFDSRPYGVLHFVQRCFSRSMAPWAAPPEHQKFLFEGTKNQPSLKGFSVLIPLHLQGELHFQFHLAMMTSTPKILASPGSSWPLCCL